MNCQEIVVNQPFTAIRAYWGHPYIFTKLNPLVSDQLFKFCVEYMDVPFISRLLNLLKWYYMHEENSISLWMSFSLVDVLQSCLSLVCQSCFSLFQSWKASRLI